MKIGRIGRGIPDWARWVIVLAGALALLSLFYLGVVLSIPYTADAGTVVVMAKAVLDGNVLLRGWILGTVSFFTTELPFYIAGILALGLGWKVIYAVSALHWALVALLVVVLSLADEPATSRLTKIGVALCLTMYLAALAVDTLYLSSAHLVAFADCLVCLLLVRRMDERTRWTLYLAYGAVLTLAMLGDAFALYLLAIPVGAVCLLRLAGRLSKPPLIPLISATAASVLVSRGLIWLLRQVGGAVWLGPSAVFVSPQALVGNVASVLGAILELFAVHLPEASAAPSAWAIDLVHLLGLLLFSAVVLNAIRRVKSLDLFTQILAAIVVVNLLENVLSTRAGSARYLAPSLIFGIVLVSRALYDWTLFRAHPRWILIGSIALGASLVPRLAYSKPVSQSDGLAKMLTELHLVNGYAPYWRANSTTVATGGSVTVRPVYWFNGRIAPYPCFSDPAWYKGYADFLVVAAGDSSDNQVGREQAIQILGQPRNVYSLGAYGDLLVWNHDITPFLGPAGPDCAFLP